MPINRMRKEVVLLRRNLRVSKVSIVAVRLIKREKRMAYQIRLMRMKIEITHLHKLTITPKLISMI